MKELKKSREDLSKEKKKFKLKKKIGFWRGLSLIVGCIMGAGIFVAPSGVIAASNGSIGLSLLVWISGGIISLLSALCYCEVTTSLKESGGTFTAINIAIGSPVGFLYIWMGLVAPTLDAATLMTFGRYASEMLVGCFTSDVENASKIFSILLLLASAFLNSVSVRGSLKFQMLCTLSKFLVLITIAVGGIGLLISGYPVGRENFSNIFSTKPLETLDWKQFTFGYYQVIYSYMGWSTLSYVCEEMQNPAVNVPLATMTAMAIVTAGYVGINIGYFSVLTPQEMLSSKAVAASFASKLFGNFHWCLPLLVCLCIIGSYHTTVLLMGRAVFASARRGLLPQFFAMANVKHYSPATAIFLNSCPAIVLICIGSFDSVIEAMGFINWTFFGLNALSVLLLRRQYPNLPRPFKVPVFVPIAVLFFSAFFIISPIIRNPTPMYFYAFIFFVVGLLVYYVFVHRQYKLPGTDQATLFCQKLFQVAITDWDCMLDAQSSSN